MATEEVSVSSKRYTDEFKIEAVRQVTERGHSVAHVRQFYSMYDGALEDRNRLANRLAGHHDQSTGNSQ